MRPGFERLSADLARLVAKKLFAPDRRLFDRLASSSHTSIQLSAQSSDVKHPMN
jgi:hypothetical protein